MIPAASEIQCEKICFLIRSVKIASWFAIFKIKTKAHHTPGKFKKIRNVKVKNKIIQLPKENMSGFTYNAFMENFQAKRKD